MPNASLQATQVALIKLGYELPRYGADGIWGVETLKALRAFCTVQGVDRPSSLGAKHALAIIALADLHAIAIPQPVEADTVQGCDVSGWQRPHEIDWSEMHDDGLRFVFVKATQGGTGISKRFALHMKAAGAAGMLRGAYHFASFKGTRKNEPREQAEHFVTFVQRHAVLDLPYVLDVEWQAYKTKAKREADLGRNYSKFPASAVNDFIDQFGQRVHELTGLLPILYTGRSFWRYRMARTKEFTNWLLWQAAYVGDGHELPKSPPTSMTPPWERVTFHQFAGGRGRAPDGDGDGETGFAKPLDRNLFAGSLSELKALAR